MIGVGLSAGKTRPDTESLPGWCWVVVELASYRRHTEMPLEHVFFKQWKSYPHDVAAKTSCVAHVNTVAWPVKIDPTLNLKMTPAMEPLPANAACLKKWPDCEEVRVSRYTCIKPGLYLA